MEAGIAAPIAADQRIAALDVLRGLALCGVMLVNMTGFADTGMMATSAQLAALPTAALNEAAEFAIDVLFGDKSNTLFACLFGLGFYVQMQRAAVRGAAFERLYLRRLTVLLIFGILHMLFLWTWDILHLYALAGFVLFACRAMQPGTMIAVGLLLAVAGRPLFEFGIEAIGLRSGDIDAVYSDGAVLLRQAAARAGDYPKLFRLFWDYTLHDWLLSGLVAGWLFYALGRHFIGAWVGQTGWLQDTAPRLDRFRRIMYLTLPTGLVVNLSVMAMDKEKLFTELWPAIDWSTVGALLLPAAALLLAAGYAAGVVVALQTPLGASIFGPFRHLGRMALSNYVGQSFVYAFVLFGVGPGLALAGRIGVLQVTLIVVAALAAQLLFSRWWLGRFRFGPLEWLWRALTYGTMPPIRQRTVTA